MSDQELQRLADLIAGRITPAAAPLVDAKAAAEQLGVPASWLLAEARAQRAPHKRLGKYVRFDVDELRAWADGRHVGPRPRARRAA